MRNPKLKPWLDEGIKRIADRGLSGLNISEIAESIDISKSSFYHYFNTKEEYLEQLLEYWEEEGTVRIIKSFLLMPEQENPVYNLIKGVFELNFTNECVLQHLRISMKQNPLIESKVNQVEKMRISFIATLINKQGLSSKEALHKSNQVYIHFLGSLALCNLQKPSAEQIKNIMEDFLDFFGEI